MIVHVPTVQMHPTAAENHKRLWLYRNIHTTPQGNELCQVQCGEYIHHEMCEWECLLLSKQPTQDQK